MQKIVAKIIVGLSFALSMLATAPAQELPAPVQTTAEISAHFEGVWTNSSWPKVIPPGASQQRVDLGLIPYTADLDTNFLGSLVGVTNAGVNVFPLSAIESTNPAHARIWFNAADTEVMTNAIGYGVEAWNTDNYGALPTYFENDPTNAAQWRADRTPERILAALALISTNDVVTYLSNTASSAASGYDTNGALVSLLVLYSNDIALVGHRAGSPLNLYLHAPASVASVGVFSTTDLVAQTWQQLIAIPHSSDPVLFQWLETGGSETSNVWRSFALGDMADTDSDGIADAVEELITHTCITNADSDGDGLMDGEEFRQYASNPAKFSTGNDGLSDGWKAQNNFNPSVYVNPSTVAANGLTYAQLSAIGAVTNAPLVDLAPNDVLVDYRSQSDHAWKVGWRQWDYDTVQPAQPRYFLQFDSSYQTTLDRTDGNGWWYSGTATKSAHAANRWDRWRIHRTQDESAVYPIHGGWTNDWNGGDGYTTITNQLQHWFEDYSHIYGGPLESDPEAAVTATMVLVDYTNSWQAGGITFTDHTFSRIDLSAEYETTALVAQAYAEMNLPPAISTCAWSNGYSRTNAAFFTTNAAATIASRDLSGDETHFVLNRLQYQLRLTNSTAGTVYRAGVLHLFTPEGAATCSVAATKVFLAKGSGGAVTLQENGAGDTVIIEPPAADGTITSVVFKAAIDEPDGLPLKSVTPSDYLFRTNPSCFEWQYVHPDNVRVRYQQAISASVMPAGYPFQYFWTVTDGVLSNEDMATPTFSAHTMAEPDTRVDVTLSLAPISIQPAATIDRTLEVYRDHLQRDFENFGVGRECGAPTNDYHWTFNRYGIKITMNHSWNCFGSVWHAYDGTHDGAENTAIPTSGFTVETNDGPIINWSTAVAGLKRGDIVAFYSVNPTNGAERIQHAHTCLGSADSMYGANNEPRFGIYSRRDSRGKQFNWKGGTFKWAITSSQEYFERINSLVEITYPGKQLLNRIRVYRRIE